MLVFKSFDAGDDQVGVIRLMADESKSDVEHFEPYGYTANPKPGAEEVALHAQVGAQAKAAGIARLHALGPLSAHAAAAFGDGALHHASHEALAAALLAELQERNDAQAGLRVLVKGSRGSAMDRIVRALLQRDAGAEGNTDAA